MWLTCSACGRAYRRLLKAQEVVRSLCGVCILTLLRFRDAQARLAAERANVRAGVRSDWPGSPHTRHDVVIGRGSPANQLDELLWDGFWMLHTGSDHAGPSESEAGE